jgi:hypothetical protein
MAIFPAPGGRGKRPPFPRTTVLGPWTHFGAAALLCLSGCWTTQPQLKPPPLPPEYVLPPADDARFSEPPAFPDKVLNEGLQKKTNGGADLGLPGGGSLRNPSGRFGGGPGGPGGPGM